MDKFPERDTLEKVTTLQGRLRGRTLVIKVLLNLVHSPWALPDELPQSLNFRSWNPASHRFDRVPVAVQ
jgi:hypothetical protein